MWKRRSFASLIVLAFSSSFPLGAAFAKEGVSFVDPLDFGVGRSPRSVAAGDFNGDSQPDLAVANFASNNVSILLGQGAGRFAEARNVSVGTNPYFVAVGAFNGDGRLDLAVANSGSDSVSILLGKGDGTFKAAHFPVGSHPWSVAVGDFNEDGKKDLAVANSGSNTVSILLGRGDGTFEAARTIGVGIGGATAVAVGDFNRDGHADLAVTNRGTSAFPATAGTVSILLGRGDGTFEPARNFAVETNPVSLAASDFNRDGILDLAVANNNSDNVSILLGNGDGTFAAAHDYPTMRGESLAVGDFNGDGFLDVVTANRHATVSILAGNGDGTFQPMQNFWAGSEPVSLVVDDFNGDMMADLAVVQTFSNEVSILLNNTPQPIDGVIVDRDILYYEGPYGSPEKQNLDVYRLPGKIDFAVVFLVYGGDWNNGAKSRLDYLARTLAREGLGVVAINHRLTDGSPEQVVHPGQIEDVARAVAWTYHHIADYGGNPQKIILMGHSSGGHLISLLATDQRYLAAHELSPSIINGVIAVSGVYNVRDLAGRPYIFGDREQRWQASPIKYVSDRQPPFQILYGGAEVQETITQAETFYQALVAANGQAELHEIPDRDHPGIIGRAARAGDPAREWMLSFIAEHTR